MQYDTDNTYTYTYTYHTWQCECVSEWQHAPLSITSTPATPSLTHSPTRLYSDAEDGDDAAQAVVLELHGDGAVVLGVPVSDAVVVQPRARLLQDEAVHHLCVSEGVRE